MNKGDNEVKGKLYNKVLKKQKVKIILFKSSVEFYIVEFNETIVIFLNNPKNIYKAIKTLA